MLAIPKKLDLYEVETINIEQSQGAVSVRGKVFMSLAIMFCTQRGSQNLQGVTIPGTLNTRGKFVASMPN